MADHPDDDDLSARDADLAWISADPFRGLARALIVGGLVLMLTVVASYFLERSERGPGGVGVRAGAAR